VKGKKLAVAKWAIKRAHCAVGKVKRAFSARVKRGRVISQRPVPGKKLRSGANLNVSKGKKEAASALAAGKSGESPPPCGPDSTLRPSILKAQSELDFGRAVATHPLRVTFGFSPAANGSSPVVDEDTPLKISAPSGVRIARGEDWYQRLITAPKAGSVPLALSWVQGISNQCSATGDVFLRLAEPKPPLVKFRLLPLGAIEMRIERVRGGDASPLRVIVRGAGPGTLEPPKRGKAVLDASVPMGEPQSERSIRRGSHAVRASLSGYAGDYELDLQPETRSANGPSGKVTDFAFAAGLFQSGRRVAWVSTGVHCHVPLLRYGYLKCFFRGLRKDH